MGKVGKAVIVREWNKPLSVEEVEVESPRRGEVMVKIAACGVCHSDLSAANGTIPMPPPLVIGHEAAGVIEEVGEGVDDIAVGDHVVIVWIPMCGKCRYCVEGRPALCDMSAKAVFTMPDGTSRLKDRDGNALNHFMGVSVMAEYATVHRDNVVKIDPEIPLDKAALVGCAVMTGVGAALNTAKVEAGSSVAVFGAGGIGLNVIQGAALAGAEKIIAVDLEDKKLEFAQQFGATHTINPGSDGDPVAKIKELTGGGADYAFECIGVPEVIAQSYDAIRKGGTAVVVGVTRADGDRDPRHLHDAVPGEGAHRLHVRIGAAEDRLPAAAQPLPVESPEARRAGHRDLLHRRDQPRLRRHAEGRERPRRPHHVTVSPPRERRVRRRSTRRPKSRLPPRSTWK